MTTKNQRQLWKIWEATSRQQKDFWGKFNTIPRQLGHGKEANTTSAQLRSNIEAIKTSTTNLETISKQLESNAKKSALKLYNPKVFEENQRHFQSRQENVKITLYSKIFSVAEKAANSLKTACNI